MQQNMLMYPHSIKPRSNELAVYLIVGLYLNGFDSTDGINYPAEQKVGCRRIIKTKLR
jgi:hypothetical protein